MSESLSTSPSREVEEQVAVNGHKGRSISSQRRGSLSSRDSSQDTLSNCSSTSGSADFPSKESISEALDKYISASRDGREAFTQGNLNEAVREFDQALDIELQTELDCLYDTSIGLVSGLVRREVDSRLVKQGKFMGNNESADARCAKILQQLRAMYQDAASGVKGKKSDSPQWYLQMGAALVVINEWGKAKAVYADGINVCKDKKVLKVALKNLIKIEQMTSYGEIPAEDQPDRKDLVPAGSSPSHGAYLKPSPHTSPAHSPRLAKRERAGSANMMLAQMKKDFRRERSGSLNLDQYAAGSRTQAVATSAATGDVTLRSAYSPTVTKRENKRLSLSFLRSYSLGKSRSPSLTSPEDVELWSNCFQPQTCPVFTHTEYRPSAITHMRRLTSIDGSGEEGESELDIPDADITSGVFTAVHRPSMKIEDDDSDMDDY